MTQKLHNDPIIYRAYGTVRGIYKPSPDDPTTGTLTTDDGVVFPVTVSYEIAALLEHEKDQLLSTALWKCYFRTRPATLHLRKVETSNIDKNRQHSFKVNKFQVDGKVIKTGKETVTVQIKPNNSEEKPFNLTLKGNLEGDLSHRFWRFKLRREGKSYHIQTATQIGLPKSSLGATKPETPQKPKQEATHKPKTETPSPAAKQPTPTHKPRVFNLVHRKL